MKATLVCSILLAIASISFNANAQADEDRIDRIVGCIESVGAADCSPLHRLAAEKGDENAVAGNELPSDAQIIACLNAQGDECVLLDQIRAFISKQREDRRAEAEERQAERDARRAEREANRDGNEAPDRGERPEGDRPERERPDRGEGEERER